MKPNNFPLITPVANTELYTQTNDIVGKFTMNSAKEFINGSEDITYLELYNKITNEELIPGNWYRLIDYKSVNFLNGWEIAKDNPIASDPNFNPQEIYEGETEVLLLQATSSSEISPIAYSESFGQDIITYLPLVNKIGVYLSIYNGSTLPDSSTVSGFDLQWDGTNVYFNMPTGYPALYGHFFYLYAEFSGGSYYIDGTYEPLNLNGVCQYPYSPMPRIKLEDNGMKVILLDLTEQDYLNLDIGTFFIDTVYALGDAYGWITRRKDTQNEIDVPFDFRSRKYRRFEVDLSSVNSSLGTGFYGIGDDFLGQGTTGNYQDFLSLNWKEKNIFNIEIGGIGGADFYSYNGFNDNNVFFGSAYNFNIKNYIYGNTVGEQFFNNYIESLSNNVINYAFYNNITENFGGNTIGLGFSNNGKIGQSFYNNDIRNFFQNNIIGNQFSNNTIGNNFISNTIGLDFKSNTIGDSFQSNTIGNDFKNNTIGDSFQYNTIGLGFQSNTIGVNFRSNNIGDIFQSNPIGVLFQYNTIGNIFINNTIGNIFQSNTIGNDFKNNTIGSIFQYNTTKYSVASTDFSLATYVYADYNCEIFKRSDSTLQLSYIDGTNTIQYTAITA